MKPRYKDIAPAAPPDLRSQELSATINLALEEKCARVARDMHDELGQMLTALKMDIDELNRKHGSQAPELSGKLSELLSFVDDIIENVRSISRELRPSMLDDLGLIAALEWQCESFAKKARIPCSFEAKVTSEHFEKSVTNAAFRIVQEALTNVSRHAMASSVEVSVTEGSASLEIKVADNGKGLLESDLKKNSLGIIGMRERAHLQRGMFGISGKPGKGTVISALLPLKPTFKQ